MFADLQAIQRYLFPYLEEEDSPLTEKQLQVINQVEKHLDK